MTPRATGKVPVQMKQRLGLKAAAGALAPPWDDADLACAGAYLGRARG